MAVKITNQKPNFGNKRSNALNATRKKQGINLQTVKLENGRAVRLTARELRTLNKQNKEVEDFIETKTEDMVVGNE